MAHVEKSIDVDVPVRTAYDQWTQFESFPQFMEGVESVQQLDATRLHWKAEVSGKTEEWDAQITEQQPDQRIAWRSINGVSNAGVVTFHKLSDTSSKVMLQVDAEPRTITEKVGDALGFLDRQVERDLERFKQFIETRQGEPTGAWRGEVNRTS